ncbi:MAG: 23S rRNA (guanosine(2251)-2'-O)-methyltransferase RlmB [Cellvibrionales bacterium]|nr:23S rRNA (guanosine(2251)-2'-O)-methyltransferase RlmB [Cellvibrionales bacterium]
MTYEKKKAFFDKVLTIYGRKPVQEALNNDQIRCFKLHLADSNKPAKILNECIQIAEQKGVEIQILNKKQLSFISKNAKQDQGIALDILLEESLSLEEVLQQKKKRLLLLDNVTNPQNIGMIIRTATAGDIDAILIPEKGCAELGPLVIKSSVGAIFHAPIVRVKQAAGAIEAIKAAGIGHKITALALSHDSQNYFSLKQDEPRVFIVGNESEGVSQKVLSISDEKVMIPMNNQVESLNVATSVALIAFATHFTP